jgi:HD superfamily phosphodiesterase
MKQLKDKLVAEMKDYFGEDRRRISHALRVTSFAEEILLEEEGDEDIVIAAAILHDIGIPVAEKKYGSSAGHYQEIEGPIVAREILRRHGYEEPFIEHVCEIIGKHHSPRRINTINFRIVYDADLLVNLGGKFQNRPEKGISERIDRIFLTETGRIVAKKQKWGKMGQHK